MRDYPNTMSPAEARQFRQSVLSIVAHNAVLQRLLHLVDDGVIVCMGHHQRLGARVAAIPGIPDNHSCSMASI